MRAALYNPAPPPKSQSSLKKGKLHHDFSTRSEVIETHSPWTFPRESDEYHGTGRHVRSESEESSEVSNED